MVNDKLPIPDADPYFGHARTEVLALLPHYLTKVVDVGGASGATLTAIRSKWPGAHTICIDGHRSSVEAARRNGHEALMCNLENELPNVFSESDVVLFLDVLEHLRDPW